MYISKNVWPWLSIYEKTNAVCCETNLFSKAVFTVQKSEKFLTVQNYFFLEIKTVHQVFLCVFRDLQNI